MTVRELIMSLGGPAAVAARRGVSVTAVFNWIAADRVAARHAIALWADAKRAGIAWRPPGAAGLDLVVEDDAAASDDAVPPAAAAA